MEKTENKPNVTHITRKIKGDLLGQDTIKRMDQLTALFVPIHTFLGHIKKEVLELPQGETASRSIYEMSLGETHLEDALIRLSRSLQYLGGK